MNVTYRAAQIGDLSALCALGNELSVLHHAALPNVFAQPNGDERDAELWRKAIEGAQSVAFVAERSSIAIGFVTGEIEDEKVTLFRPVRFCRVGTLAVTLSERGRGIGSALMASLEKWALSHSAAEIHLNVWRFNEAAHCCPVKSRTNSTAVSRVKCNTRVIELKREVDESQPVFEQTPAAA